MRGIWALFYSLLVVASDFQIQNKNAIAKTPKIDTGPQGKTADFKRRRCHWRHRWKSLRQEVKALDWKLQRTVPCNSP
jgi:hypothetical protein